MSLTVSDLITQMNTYIGDTSNDRVTAAQRLQYGTEAVVWLQEELGNAHQNRTYGINYFDHLHTYQITVPLPDTMNAVDLRRQEKDQYHSFIFRNSREIAEKIAQKSRESCYTIERHDSAVYLKINHLSKYPARLIS